MQSPPVSGEIDTPQDPEEAGEEHIPSALELPGGERAPKEVRDIPLDEIAELKNIRPAYYGIEKLAETMHLEGQLQPCLVRPAAPDAEHGKPYELIFGYRRKKAAEYLREQGIEGWDSLRCEVREVTDERQLAKTIVENFQRQQLSPVAEARAMLALKHSHDPPLSNAEVARQLGCDPSHVSHRIKMLIGLALPEQRDSLPEAYRPQEEQEKEGTGPSVEEQAEEATVHTIQVGEEPAGAEPQEHPSEDEGKPRIDILEMVDRGEIPASTAEVIASLEDRDQQEKLAQLVVRNNWNVKKAASWVRKAQEHVLDEGDDEELGPVEMVRMEDVVELQHLRVRKDLSEEEIDRVVAYALLRNGMDREILDYLAEEMGYPYEQLWNYVASLDDGQVRQLIRRLAIRYVSAAHRWFDLEPELKDALGVAPDPAAERLLFGDPSGSLPEPKDGGPGRTPPAPEPLDVHEALEELNALPEADPDDEEESG